MNDEHNVYLYVHEVKGEKMVTLDTMMEALKSARDYDAKDRRSKAEAAVDSSWERNTI